MSHMDGEASGAGGMLSGQEGVEGTERSMSDQAGAGRPRGRREVKTASSAQECDERSRRHRMAKGDLNMKRCLRAGKAMSGQEGFEWSGGHLSY